MEVEDDRMLDTLGALILRAICVADLALLIGLAAIRPVASF